MREFIQINRDWYFTGPDGLGTAVDLPHTWNAVDGQDGGNDYWRGTCLYEKDFTKPQYAADERIYLEFRGVNASAKAELNGELIGTHDGGYSTFRWDIMDFLADEIHLKVWADNSRNDRVYPQKADFTFYGGIYRDVFLIRVNEKHFDMDHFGGPGIKVTARPTEGYTRGEVRVETYTNCEDGEVTVRILDADGKCVAQGSGTDAQMRIENARIRNGVKDPYLYTAQAVLTVDGKEADSVETRFGVRDFATDPKNGFYLNGKRYPLHGVSRHQDRKGIGLDALPTKATPYTDGMNIVVIILFCIVPMCAWALTLWSMTGYELDGERVKEIQEVNGKRREAIAQGHDDRRGDGAVSVEMRRDFFQS